MNNNNIQIMDNEKQPNITIKNNKIKINNLFDYKYIYLLNKKNKN